MAPRSTALVWLIAAAAAAVGAAGCHRQAVPDPRVARLEKRVAELEDINERMDELWLRLDKLIAATKSLAELEARVDAATGTEGESVENKLEKLDAKLSEIERKVVAARRPTPYRPPPPPRRPDPAVTYSVPVKGAPYSGPRYAHVTLVKGFEFACPYCFRTRATLDQLQKQYGKKLRIVYKHFIVHPSSATTPARAACAANFQGKFNKMKKLIWDKGFAAGRNLSMSNMETLARSIGINIPKMRADMSGKCAKIVQQDQADLRKVGQQGTPGFWINGRFLSGAQPINKFKTLIDEELKKAKTRIRKGTKLRKYYDTWVVKKGKKSL